MSSLLPQLSHEVSSFLIRYIQTHRIFDFIQQNTDNPKHAITTQNMTNFFKKYYHFNDNDAISLSAKLMLSIQKQSVQINNDLLAANLAKETKNIILAQEGSLANFYSLMGGCLTGNSIREIQKFEKWDQGQQDQNMRYLQIQKCLVQNNSFIDGVEITYLQHRLPQLNIVLSISTLPLPILEKEIITVYNNIFKHKTIEYISNYLPSFLKATSNMDYLNSSSTISLNNMDEGCFRILSFLRFLSYFYDTCKYPHFKEQYQSSHLFSPETFHTILITLKIPHHEILRQATVCLALVSKNVERFSEWMLFNMGQVLYSVIKISQGLIDFVYIYEMLAILKHVIRRCSKYIAQNQDYIKTMQYISSFCFWVLKNNSNSQTQIEAILIIGEIVNILKSNIQLEDFKMLNNVYATTQNQILTSLVPVTLRVLQIAAVNNADELVHIAVKSSEFLSCIENHLGRKQSSFYYQFFHVLYSLSINYLNLLIENNIVTKVLERGLGENANFAVISITVELILRCVQQATQNNKLLQALYDKELLFDKIIPNLFKKITTKDSNIASCMDRLTLADKFPNENISHQYFDKYLLFRVFTMLYILATGVSRRNKKYAFSRKLNQMILVSLSEFLNGLFGYQNHALVKTIYRQKLKVRIQSKNSNESNQGSEVAIPFYKMVYIIIEQMTYNMEGRDIQFLKIIDQLKKTYCKNLLKKGVVSLSQLQVEGIPIYLTISFECSGRPCIREVPHKFELGSLKVYLKQFALRLMNERGRQNQIKDVIVRDLNTNNYIQNQVQYRIMVNKQINSKNLDFKLQINLKYKNAKQSTGMGSSYIVNSQSPNRGSQQMSNSFMGRQNNPTTMHTNRHVTQRVQNWQLDNEARRGNLTPNYTYTYNNNNRGTSPAFGYRQL